MVFLPYQRRNQKASGYFLSGTLLLFMWRVEIPPHWVCAQPLSLNINIQILLTELHLSR